jgi:hypothetical protein
MNRSAQDGARSSWHYGSEGVLTHPSYQGACGRHGTEDLDATPRRLVVFSGGTGISDLYKSADEVGSDARRVVGQASSTSSLVKAR